VWDICRQDAEVGADAGNARQRPKGRGLYWI
jgi:hypothetical protein